MIRVVAYVGDSGAGGVAEETFPIPLLTEDETSPRYGNGFFADLHLEMPILTSLEDLENELPNAFALEQNYPNPFNPTTTIRYSVPVASDIQLTVHNVIGQKVAELYSGTQQAGRFTVDWDASRFSSGVYFVVMQGDAFRQTRKMLLIK